MWVDPCCCLVYSVSVIPYCVSVNSSWFCLKIVFLTSVLLSWFVFYYPFALSAVPEWENTRGVSLIWPMVSRFVGPRSSIVHKLEYRSDFCTSSIASPVQVYKMSITSVILMLCMHFVPAYQVYLYLIILIVQYNTYHHASTGFLWRPCNLVYCYFFKPLNCNVCFSSSIPPLRNKNVSTALDLFCCNIIVVNKKLFKIRSYLLNHV